jgi:hypothetical protein
MAFLTFDQARQLSRAAWVDRGLAESEVRKSASLSMDTEFDVFLSHSFKDAEVIRGVKIAIESAAASVYVDWIADAQLDRSQVSAGTAEILRDRMKHCRFLLYVTSAFSSDSKWMPWELGYFDGLKGSDKVGIFPLVQSEDDYFVGQEYLGLYHSYEMLEFKLDGLQVGRRTAKNSGERLSSAVLR